MLSLERVWIREMICAQDQMLGTLGLQCVMQKFQRKSCVPGNAAGNVAPYWSSD